MPWFLSAKLSADPFCSVSNSTLGSTAPLAFDLSPGSERLLNAIEGLILVVFVVEFLVQLAAARDRRAWLTSPWRIVDAVCIVGPAISFLPRV